MSDDRFSFPRIVIEHAEFSMSSEETIAYHEAGHALMAWKAGARIESLTIDPESDDSLAREGEARVIWEPSRYTAQEFAICGISVALAGPVAELVQSGSDADEQQLNAWTVDWKEAWEAAGRIHHSPEARLTMIEAAVRDLRLLFEDERWWSALAAIADHLLAWDSLEHDDVEEIAEHWLS